MPVYKNKKTGSWYVMAHYQDWTGENKQKCKRGFVTKREAQEWECNSNFKRKLTLT